MTEYRPMVRGLARYWFRRWRGDQPAWLVEDLEQSAWVALLQRPSNELPSLTVSRAVKHALIRWIAGKDRSRWDRVRPAWVPLDATAELRLGGPSALTQAIQRQTVTRIRARLTPAAQWVWAEMADTGHARTETVPGWSRHQTYRAKRELRRQAAQVLV